MKICKLRDAILKSSASVTCDAMGFRRRLNAFLKRSRGGILTRWGFARFRIHFVSGLEESTCDAIERHEL